MDIICPIINNKKFLFHNFFSVVSKINILHLVFTPLNIITIHYNFSFIFVNYIQINLARISHNVTGIRRSSPPYKANRRFAVGWNVAKRKPHKGEADCGFSQPEGANSARSVYRMLSDVSA
jgi:hypothetical protein